MKKVIFLSLGALMMASGAAAADGEGAEKIDKKDPKQWVCKVEKMTGSLTRTRRICMKRDEWDQLAQGTGEGVSKFVSESQHMAASLATHRREAVGRLTFPPATARPVIR